MDDFNIDAVARAVAAGASRRQVLRLLAIGTVTAWLPRRVEAAPARQGCVEGLTDCGGGCADLSSDPFNCGGCGIVCEGCAAGTCPQVSLGCVLPLVECAGLCADLSSDPFSCGGCGIACPSGVCEGGACSSVNVDIGCVIPTVMCGGGCVDLSSDPNNCGACGNVCPDGGVCAAGTCPQVSLGCVSPLVECGGFCVDLGSDPNNCGACGTGCPSGVCNTGVCAPLTCEAGLTYCEAFGACFDLASNATHCGTCGTVCESGVCISGRCTEPTTTPVPPTATATTTSTPPAATATTTPTTPAATPAAPTPTSTPPTDGGATGTPKPRRDRSSREQGTGSESSPADTASGSATQAEVKQAKAKKAADTASGSATQAEVKQAKAKKAAATKDSASVLAWPFDPEAGQWTIVNGYRGEGEHAPPPNNGQNYALFALDFAVCRPENVDVAKGTCELSPASESSGTDADEPGWDTAATRGTIVLSPVDGTVAWTEEAGAACPIVGIAITGHPGYRLALFNVEGHPEVGESVKQGKRIGKVAKGGCEEGDPLHMVLYQPQAGAADDPEEGRTGVPFTGDWTIAGCDFPDDKKTANQYRGVLVPCTP